MLGTYVDIRAQPLPLILVIIEYEVGILTCYHGVVDSSTIAQGLGSGTPRSV